ncbi:MAG: hypothetical protein U9R60_15150 [Bacteroidota bacterium]|nr:hypothetical protein [Bacteroidota bacterium]
MKKRILTIIMLTSVFSMTFAQTAVDALRYSRLFVGGTARYMALGGAYGAVGADFTVLSTNPAGIGLYRSSEFTITPSIFTGTTEANYNSIILDDSRTNFNLGNVGLIFNRSLLSTKNKPTWKNVQFGIGINRLKDFNRRMLIKGYNPDNSLLDVYSSYATDNNIPFDQIEQDYDYMYAYDLNPAWWTYLMDTMGGPASYVNPVIVPGASQTLQAQSWGSMNEFVFSMGGNFNDIVYVGGTFSIPWIRYYQESSYVEDFDSPQNDLTRFYYNTELETRASGFNFKFGLLVRPVEWLRIGGAIHTPTFYNNIRDYNRVYMSSEFKTLDTAGYSSYSKNNAWTKYYELTTPFKAMANIAFIIAPYGLISADYEYVDYANARFQRTADWVNADIQTGYTSTHNIRIGTEWRYDIFSFRAGYAYYASPYNNDINDGSVRSYSGGIGFKISNYFFDFAYVYSKSEEDYYLYGYDEYVAKSENTLKSQRLLFTFGTRF